MTMGRLADGLLLGPPTQLDPPVTRDRRGVEPDRTIQQEHPHLFADRDEGADPFNTERGETVAKQQFRFVRCIRNRQSNATARCCSTSDCDVTRIGVAIDTQNHAVERPVAKHVALADQRTRVVLDREPVLPPHVERLLGRSQPVIAGIAHGAQAEDVVGSAGLRTAADRRALPSAERLTLHNGAGDVSIDVGIADLHQIQPTTNLLRVE